MVRVRWGEGKVGMEGGRGAMTINGVISKNNINNDLKKVIHTIEPPRVS